MNSTIPPVAELIAPAGWQTVDFISDLHLHAGDTQTVQAWTHYLDNTRADAVFILGDLFDVWIGNDALDAPSASLAESGSGFELQCARTLRHASQRCAMYFLHGNRDFLLGADAARICGMQLLDDPTVLSFAGKRWLLTHGDALCLADVPYQEWRRQVRGSQWQDAFLSKPLAERRTIARGLRAQSEAYKRANREYADVDNGAALAWLAAADATEMIHGHTHRPADHSLALGQTRRVLSDWDLSAAPARKQVLRLQKPSTGHTVIIRRLAPDGCF